MESSGRGQRDTNVELGFLGSLFLQAPGRPQVERSHLLRECPLLAQLGLVSTRQTRRYHTHIHTCVEPWLLFTSCTGV